MPAPPFLTTPATVVPTALSAVLTGLPVLTLDEVFHVGTLDFADRAAWSYEGDGLSVSVHPEEWAQIARLGHAVWRVTRSDEAPFRFVDFHAVTADDRDLLRGYALSQGWMAQQVVWQVTFDTESGGQSTLICNTEADAAEEAEGLDATIAATWAWRSTPSFPEARVSHDWDPHRRAHRLLDAEPGCEPRRGVVGRRLCPGGPVVPSGCAHQAPG